MRRNLSSFASLLWQWVLLRMAALRQVCSRESAPAWNAGAAGATGAAAAAPAPTSSLVALLTGHILQDGELVLLILKPSLWFIPLSMLRSAAAIFIFMMAGVVWRDSLPGEPRLYVEIGVFLLAGRLTWAVLQWMSRLYILTDMRILRLSGIFTVNIFDCPLRKVVRTRLLYTVREQICRTGSIEIIPADEEYPIGLWQTIACPVMVNDQIVAAINRTRQGRLVSHGL